MRKSIYGKKHDRLGASKVRSTPIHLLHPTPTLHLHLQPPHNRAPTSSLPGATHTLLSAFT